MTEGSILTNELRKWVGHEFKPVVYEIEKGAIKKLAQATGDPCPLWQDEEYAGKSRYGSIIAPPAFVASLRVYEADEWLMSLDLPLKRGVNAGIEVELFKPIRPGDVITVTARIADLSEREGRSGKMLLAVFERTFTNQRGEVVAKLRISGMRF